MSIECSLICTYTGHRDGVWQVARARNGLPVIGSASAGTLRVFCMLSELLVVDKILNTNFAFQIFSLYCIKSFQIFSQCCIKSFQILSLGCIKSFHILSLGCIKSFHILSLCCIKSFHILSLGYIKSFQIFSLWCFQYSKS